MRSLVLAAVTVVLLGCQPAPLSIPPPAEGGLPSAAMVSSSEAGPGAGVRTIIDGDLNTAWTGPEPPYWFEVDLGEQVMIGEVRLLPGRDADAMVMISVGVHDNPGRQPGSVSSVTAGEWIAVEVGYEARFIRVTTIEAAGMTSWIELEVIGQ